MKPGAAVVAGALLVAAFSAIVIAQSAQKSASAKASARQAQPLGIGRVATADEIRAIDIDVMPDGRGLPPGKGTVAEGAAVYAAKCAGCHGAKGEGGKFDRLVGLDPKTKTIGSYWPYATTLYDYTARSMPFFQPGTLKPDEVYGVVAYLLHLNEIVPETAVMDAKTLPQVKMPARDKFVKDDRTGGKVIK
jgi:mono/diheme cytochrome c family protein